jgi:hypothetical protein
VHFNHIMMTVHINLRNFPVLQVGVIKEQISRMLDKEEWLIA